MIRSCKQKWIERTKYKTLSSSSESFERERPTGLIMPLRHDSLRSQVEDCCRAHKLLSDRSDLVNSVEYDGPPPDCNAAGVEPSGGGTLAPDDEPPLLGGWGKDQGVDEESLSVWKQVGDAL